MSKTPVDWTFQEVVASAKLDQMTLDEMRKGQLIISSFGAHSSDLDTGPGPILSTAYLGYYPYHPAKQTFDRMRIVGVVGSTYSVVEVRYNLASGVGGWTHATLAEAFTPPIGPAFGFTANTGPGMTTVDLSGITTFEWIGVRIELSGATSDPVSTTWTIFAFLYNSTDTPF